MAQRQKISQMAPKGANLEATDLLEISEASGSGYITKSITGAELVGDYVPYIGATQDVDLGEFELKAGQLELDQTPTGTPGVAVMRWNDSDGTVDLGLKGGNVTLQVGQEQVLRVVNKTATNINLLEANYQAVRVTGAQGQRLKVDLAQATNDLLSAETIGLVTETINNNQEGFITTSGLVRGVNTTGSLQGETWADGDIVYLSSTTAGNITNIKPVAPNHLIIIGYVVSAHITQGSIFVKVDNGYELDELHNVLINSGTLVNNDALIYESSSLLWKNKTIATALGYTPVTNARTISINGTTQDLSANRTYTVTDANLSTSDITTNDVSITKHGFAPKAPNDTTKFLRGDGTWATAGGGLTVGTTAVTSGTIGRVFFEGTGNVVQQSASLFWDNTNSRLGVGATPASTVRLDVRAQGALSTDIAFRVRNSADTGNHITVYGNDNVSIGRNGSASAVLFVRSANSAAHDVLTLQNGLYGDALFRVRDNATGSVGSTCSFFMNGRLYGGNSTGLGKEFDLGGYGLGASYGDNGSNAVWLNNQGNVGDGTGSSVISVSSNFYINRQTVKVFKFIPNVGNFGVNVMTFGTSATNTIAIANGVAPTTSPADAIQFYSNDITAGNAAPHFRTENGSIVKLYQETTGVTASTFVTNTSGILNDTATFDGYTIGQVVKALRNLGILA